MGFFWSEFWAHLEERQFGGFWKVCSKGSTRVPPQTPNLGLSRSPLFLLNGLSLPHSTPPLLSLAPSLPS